MNKRWRRRLLGSAPARLLLGAAERVAPQRGGGGVLTVLTYHETPPTFATQLDWLGRRHRFVGGREVLAALRDGRPLPDGALWLTFDDAYDDFTERAWPALRARAIPTTMFVPTAYPGRPDRHFWWLRLQHALRHTERREPLATGCGELSLDGAAARERAWRALRPHLKALPHERAMAELEALYAALAVAPQPNPVLGWDALRALEAEGLELAPHTRTHPMLDRIAPAAAEAEIRGALEDLQRECGDPLPILAYPSGQHDDAAVAAAARAGMELALTTANGRNRPGFDRLRVRRVNVGPFADVAALRLRLLLTRA